MTELMDLFESQLTHVDYRIRPSEWIPQQWGVIPHIDSATGGSTRCG